VPEPYNRTQLRALQSTLDDRWPKLPREEAEKWLPRFQEFRSPYSRIRLHAIRCQLDCIVSLALHLGLRRGEIFRLTLDDIDPYNAGVLVRHKTGSLNRARMVPWTGPAWSAADEWLRCRSYLVGLEHKCTWLGLHARPTMRLPIRRFTFDKLLVTYVGSEWSFSRLRSTSAVAWSRVGLPAERLRELLGLRRLADVMPYLALGVTGTLERDMLRLNGPFMHIVEPGGGWSNRPVNKELVA
jgi:integrase